MASVMQIRVGFLKRNCMFRCKIIQRVEFFEARVGFYNFIVERTTDRVGVSFDAQMVGTGRVRQANYQLVA